MATAAPGGGFQGTGVRWHHLFCIGDQVCRLGDVDGDGKTDAISFRRNP